MKFPIPFYFEALIRLLYPASCGICSKLLELEEQGLCTVCQNRLACLTLPTEDTPLDGKFKAVDEGWALYPYESPVRELISAIKFLKKRWLIRVFRDAISPLILAITAETNYDGLIPIPMDTHKLLSREFNQSELIARLLQDCSDIPVRSCFLRKRRHTPSQGSLSQKERQINLYRAFEVPDPKKIEGKSFLLVDDIVTTGATAEEAARTLKNCGAKHVGLFTLARTELKN